MSIPQRRLGTSDLYLPTAGLGCNNFGRPSTVTETAEGTAVVLNAALDAGVTFLDGADMYGTPLGRSEELIGDALRGRRGQFILASKFGYATVTMPGTDDWGPKGGARYINNAIDASLRRLQTDYLDLYQMHSPCPEVPIADTLGALQDLIDAGKVRAIGHSNFTADQLVAADRTASELNVTAFASAQNEYNLLAQQADLGALQASADRGLGFLPYYPLANGLFSGKYTQGNSPADGRLVTIKPELLRAVDWDQLQKYQQICDEAGLSMLAATYGWLLARPQITSVIAGATKPEQITANAAAAATVLSTDTLTAIDGLFATPVDL